MKKEWILSVWVLLIFCVPWVSHAEVIQRHSYKDGMAKGKSENKKIFLNFYADW